MLLCILLLLLLQARGGAVRLARQGPVWLRLEWRPRAIPQGARAQRRATAGLALLRSRPPRQGLRFNVDLVLRRSVLTLNP